MKKGVVLKSKKRVRKSKRSRRGQKSYYGQKLSEKKEV